MILKMHFMKLKKNCLKNSESMGLFKSINKSINPKQSRDKVYVKQTEC